MRYKETIQTDANHKPQPLCGNIGVGDEVSIEDEIVVMLKKISPIDRAEMIISQYCKVMHQSEELDREFESWLRNNAYYAMQTEAFEEYFFAFLDSSDDLNFDTDQDDEECMVFMNRDCKR